MDATEKLLRGIQKLTKDRDALYSLVAAVVKDETRIIPSRVFEEGMGINANTAKNWADAGIIHRFRLTGKTVTDKGEEKEVVSGRSYVNLDSLDEAYRDAMRKQNYCFELGRFIPTVTERKALGIQYGFCKKTGDFIGIPPEYQKKHAKN